MDVIHLNQEFYILATSSLADDRTRVLKEGETFAVFDRYGDIQPVGLDEQGIYHRGTRFLSRLELKMAEQRFFLLSSNVKEDNSLLGIDLTNPDICEDGKVVLPRGSLHLFRSKFLWRGACYERIRIHNYCHRKVDFSFSLFFEADYADIFEVRGTKRAKRGTLLPGETNTGEVVLAYQGRDGLSRQTRIRFSPSPKWLSPIEADFEISLEPDQDMYFYWTYIFEMGQNTKKELQLTYADVFEKAEEGYKEFGSIRPRITTSNEQFNDWLNQSFADLGMMVTQTPQGLYPYAGVPWFSVPFGRDGVITALECLWVVPEIARGVLGYLASNQAEEDVPEQDAEPGKIIHEVREGEMVNLGEIIFGRYYGSIDATPLFIILASQYFERTGDIEFIDFLWPHIDQALQWIDQYGDRDGDGFVEYQRRAPRGLLHQGWKDSDDAVFHADGSHAKGPIALCEVQGYVYAAKRDGAAIASRLGMKERSQALLRSAAELKKRFDKVFWCNETGMFALALDGKKRPCRVRTSNPGYCLFSGIATPEKAILLRSALLSKSFYSGWGIRTVASTEVLYNPMSYHNGSVWPHDNALIARGFSRYGFREAAMKVMTGLFDASLFMEVHRLPELFCGFIRRPGMGPTSYPVACSPQAWAAGAVFLLLESLLGIHFQQKNREIHFVRPLLPPYLETVTIENLLFREASVDLLLRRRAEDVSVEIMRREGDVDLVVTK